MNPTHDDMPPIDDQQFDLLADGELSESERRDLLSALDGTADGWRRCALAFLEAQTWKEQMPSISGDRASEPRLPPAVRPRRFGGRVWGTLAAMAASFLVAIGLSLLLHKLWNPGGPVGPGPRQIAGAPDAPERPAAKPDPSAGSLEPGQSWTLVKLPIRSGPEGTQMIQIPAAERERVDEEWLEGFRPPSPPAGLLRVLRENGHQMRQSRQWLRVLMDDQRQLILPVDEFDFQYVGNSAFQ